MAAPVQLEALAVAVRGADGEPVTRQEVRSPRAAPGQSLRLVQLLALRTLLSPRGGHANISRIDKKEPRSVRPGRLHHPRASRAPTVRVAFQPGERRLWTAGSREPEQPGYCSCRRCEHVPQEVGKGRQLTACNGTFRGSHGRGPHGSSSSRRVAELLCALVTRASQLHHTTGGVR